MNFNKSKLILAATFLCIPHYFDQLFRCFVFERPSFWTSRVTWWRWECP